MVIGKMMWHPMFDTEEVESLLVLEHNVEKDYSVCKVHHKDFVVNRQDRQQIKYVSDYETFSRLHSASSWFKIKVFIGASFFKRYHETIREFVRSFMLTTNEVDGKEKIRLLKDFINMHIIPDERTNTMMDILDELCQEVSTMILKNKKAKVIQDVWRHVVSNPNHYICQQRLMREWDYLVKN